MTIRSTVPDFQTPRSLSIFPFMVMSEQKSHQHKVRSAHRSENASRLSSPSARRTEGSHGSWCHGRDQLKGPPTAKEVDERQHSPTLKHQQSSNGDYITAAPGNVDEAHSVVIGGSQRRRRARRRTTSVSSSQTATLTCVVQGTIQMAKLK